jgi:hypothetical protein
MSPTPITEPSGSPAGMQRGLWLSLLALGVMVALIDFPADDALRHVGLAFGEARSWGDVYPFSGFADRGGYDPWLGHDLALRGLARVLGLLPISRLAQQVIATKLVSCAFALLLLWLAVKRSGLMGEVRAQRDLALAMLLVLLLLGFSVRRMLLGRPFAYGTFFLLYAAGARGAVAGAASSGVLFFFYPYLAALYTVPAALAHLLRGSRAFAAGAAAATGLAIAVQPSAFWGLLVGLLRADRLRATLIPQIGEFGSALGQAGLWALLVALLVVALPRFSAEARRLTVGHLLALAFLLPALKYGRYLLDAVLPLVFVVFAGEAMRVFSEPLGRVGEAWRGLLRRRERPDPARPGRSLLPLIAVAYLAVLAAAGLLSLRSHREAQRLQSLLEPVPRGALVLSQFNLQYLTLFVRPDLRLVPSSELGLPAAGIRDEYRAFFNRGEACPLAARIGAAFLLEGRAEYLDPRSACLVLAAEQEHTRLWQIIGSR